MAACVAVYWDPALRDTGRPLLIVGGAAGFGGALGNRLIDLVAQVAQRRLE
jgi:short-subunit dehydrogenase involved in D-alanine esterification of teichoic acids